jgi:hypothetical protein
MLCSEPIDNFHIHVPVGFHSHRAGMAHYMSSSALSRAHSGTRANYIHG